MTIQQRKSHLIKLGTFLSQFSRTGIQKDPAIKNQEPYFEEMKEQVEMAVHYNGWFTRENVLFALEEWSKALIDKNLEKWLEPYNFNNPKKTVAIVMAGNIPMVGFHDFLAVIASGHRVLVKQSSNDQKLIPVIARYLFSLEPAYRELINFTDGKLQDFDAVIATGSNNTARYFEYYFAGKPSIIRKNRNSIAVLDGHESETELQALGEDIFRYFGLGCRNVSKLYVPVDYDFDAFYKAIAPWEELLNHAKYANNYDYNKAVYLMSEFKFLDNGFLILKDEEKFGSPIATIFYETYSGKDHLKQMLLENRDQLQCIVGKGITPEDIPYGQTQHPALWDFADDVNTLAFLETL